MAEQSTDLVLFNPHTDVRYQKLQADAIELSGIADGTTITDKTSLALATDNLGALADRLKLVKEAQAAAKAPLQQAMTRISEAFAFLNAPLNYANTTLRQKIAAFHQTERDEAARVAEIARKEKDLAALKGEPAPEATPVAPEPPAVTRGEHTQSGERWLTKYELIDFSLVPDEYKKLDDTKVGQAVRSSKGTLSIPGIRIFQEPVVAIGRGR